MEWVAAVAASVGLGVLAGWIYVGFPGLRRGRRSVATGQIRGVSFANVGPSEVYDLRLSLETGRNEAAMVVRRGVDPQED